MFTKAIPFLTLVFLAECVNAFDADAGWKNLALGLAGLALLVFAFGVVNVASGRRFISIPSRVGVPELAAFVLLPALLPIVFDQQFLFGFNTVLVNLALLALVYLVIGFGLVSIVRWTGARFFAQLASAASRCLIRAVPLLLFFSLISFFTTEIWQTFALSGTATFWAAMLMFFAARRLVPHGAPPRGRSRDPGGIARSATSRSDRRSERNLALVALISESLQVLFVSVAVWLFYVALGGLLVTEQVRESWLGEPGRTCGRSRIVRRPRPVHGAPAASRHRGRGLLGPLLRRGDPVGPRLPRPVRRLAHRGAPRDVRAARRVPASSSPIATPRQHRHP